MATSTTNPFTVLSSLSPNNSFPSTPPQASEGRKKTKRRIFEAKQLAAALAVPKIEGREKAKRRVYEAKVLEAAVVENPFLGVGDLFGVSGEEDGEEDGEGKIEGKGKTKRERKRDKRAVKERGRDDGGEVSRCKGKGCVDAGLRSDIDGSGMIRGEDGSPGQASPQKIPSAPTKRKRSQAQKKREKAARDAKRRHLDSHDACMGLLEWEDGLLAAQEAGRVADQWAIVDAIEDDAFERDADKVYEFRVTKSNGISVFALEDIKQGTMIMWEEALLQTPKDASLEAVARGFMRLSPGDQAMYLELDDGVALGQWLAWKNKIELAFRSVGAREWCWGRDNSELFKILAIRQINGLKVGEEGDAVFPGISRINHSCLPNAHVCWNEKLGRMMVYLTRDVVAGEEITANYLSDVEALWDREARSQKLENWWNFRCDCAACDASTALGVASERRRANAAGLMEDFENMQEEMESMVDALERMRTQATSVVFDSIEYAKDRLEQKRRDLLDVVREQASLLEEEGLLSFELVRIYREAATLSAEVGNFGKAREWIQKAADLALICGGKDHEMYEICDGEFQDVHELCMAEKIEWEEAKNFQMRKQMEKRRIGCRNSPVSTSSATSEEEVDQDGESLTEVEEERLVEEIDDRGLVEDDGYHYER